MIRRTLTVALVLAGSCGFAPAPVYRGKPASGVKMLQGTWLLVSLSRNGGESLAEHLVDIRMVIADGRVSYTNSGEDDTQRTIAIDPRAKPNRLDIRNDRGLILEGIYRVEGDTLTLCYRTSTGVPRQAEFEGGEGIGLEVWRRDKR